MFGSVLELSWNFSCKMSLLSWKAALAPKLLLQHEAAPHLGTHCRCQGPHGAPENPNLPSCTAKNGVEDNAVQQILYLPLLNCSLMPALDHGSLLCEASKLWIQGKGQDAPRYLGLRGWNES